MGEVIRFPDEAAALRGRYVDASSEPATVIILPVVRIDRSPDSPDDTVEPHTGNGPNRRRRRRG